MDVYISFDGDHIGREVGRLALQDDEEGLRRISHSIEMGNELWAKWVEAKGGSVISAGGDEGRIKVSAEHLEEIPSIRKRYESLVGSTVSVGVGRTLSESNRALIAAKLRGGDQVLMYEEGLEDEIEQAQNKGEEGQKIFSEYLEDAPPTKKELAESLYTPYNEELEKSEKLPHYLKFMGNHPKAQETAEWADNNLKHRNLAEFAMRHAQTKPEGLSHEEKAHIQHFSDSLHMAEVQKAAGSLNSKHDFNSGLQILKDAEGEYLKRHAATAPKLVPHEGKKVIDLGDGVAVYDLPLNRERKNPNEATALGHCATPHKGGNLWSIRKDHGNGQAEPMVTLSHEGGYLGEIKGKANWKPSTKFHPYIAKLMASDLIKGFVGGGYAPESNFEFSDMKEGLRKKLLDYKPSLKQKVYKEELPEGFRGNYSHAPEVKSIFSTNDIQAQIAYLQKHPAGSLVHKKAAGNKNIHPELLKYLVESNEAGSLVHEKAAGNQNIHPETLKWLVENNKAGSRVHEFAAQNKNISPELLKYLIDNNEVGSWVHQYAAQNQNIHPETLKWLVENNKSGSYTHYYAAQNKNIHPETLKWLVENNEAGSLVHAYAAQNENIHPELLKYLVESNEAGSLVHEKAAGNQNIHPETLKWLVENNKAGSYVHEYAAERDDIHPETLKWLVENNKAGSKVHEYAAFNKNIHPETLKWLVENNKAGSDVHASAAQNENIHPETLKYLVENNESDSGVHYYAAGNQNIHPETLKYLIDNNESDSGVHQYAAQNENIHPETLKYLVENNESDSGVHQYAARNPQFKNLPPETQLLVRPYMKENIQKLISIMNDEENPEAAKVAHQELIARRKEKYDKILSPEGSTQDLLHYAESHDEDTARRAKAELRRRNLIKAERPMSPAKPIAEASEHSQGEAMANFYQNENPPQPELTHAAEGLQNLEGEFHQMAQQQDQAPQSESGNQELKSRLAGILQKLKGQAPILEQMKQQAPETYAAIMAMVQSVISMARSLSSDAPKQPERQETQGAGEPEHPLYTPYNEELEKSEKLPHYLKFMGNHPKAQETAEWADNNLKHRNLAEFAMRHAQTKPEGLNEEEKAHIQHFNDSLHMAEVQKAAGSLNSKHDFNSGLQILKDAEGEYLKRHAATAPKLVPHEGKKVIDLGDGVAVYDLPLNDKRKNPNEATALGHCATPHKGGNLWSIRKDHGNGQAEPMVTISHEGGYLGEIKGKANWKPSTKFHPYIAKLMASDLIKGFVGGGYAPESNFEFSDMKEGLRKKLLDYKPSLKQKVYKEELPEGFQNDYSHAPEVKSVFKTNDFQSQIAYLQKHRANYDVHAYAAENKNIHPETLKWLIDNNKAGSAIHYRAAGNQNIHPETLKWLIDNNEADSGVHRNAARNQNIHPELLKYLVEKNRAGSLVHAYAAQNKNIHPELLKHLVENNQAGSNVHRHAAENPNISPETLKYLVENNKGDSDIHASAAQNKNISPETLKHLIDYHYKAGSLVQRYAALNENITPELLKYLVYKNEASSWVHRHAAKNKNISPELLKYLIDIDRYGFVAEDVAGEEHIGTETLKYLIDNNEAGSRVHKNAAINPQFKNLPLETQQKIRPLVGENIQKLISIMNDEENPEAAKVAHQELIARRKEKYDKILSHEGSQEDLLHYAESHDNDVSERAREELKRRNLIKSERQDVLHGGAADEKDYGDFDPEQLKIGIKHEMEHTKSAKIAAEIAMDHLTEDPDYYKKLKTIEKTDLPASGRHNLVLPTGSTITTGTHSRKDAGRVKVQHGNGKSSWVHVRSGQILSEDGHAISSRNPKGR